MIDKNHIIKKSRVGCRKTAPLKRKNLWSYPSIALIVSAVSVGFDTREQLANKKDEVMQPISNGVLNKFLKKLCREQYLTVTNPAISKRKGQSFRYIVNYDKFIDELFNHFLDEVSNQQKIVEKSIGFIEKRITKLSTQFEIYKRARSQLKKESHLVDRIKTQIYLAPTPHNVEDISGVTRSLGKLNISLTIYKSVKKELEKFQTLCKNAKQIQFSESEKKLLMDTIKGLLHFSIISNKKNRTLSDIIAIVVQMIKNGSLQYFWTKSFDSIEEGYQAKFTQPLNEEVPSLFKMQKYWSAQRELEHILN